MRALILYYLKFSWMEKGAEMEDLARSAGYTVVADLVSRKIHKENYLSDIRFAELEELVNTNNVSTIIVNEPVSVKHMRKFEEFFQSDDINIVDKTMLILEIFERKASGLEIKLQIDLAKLSYTEPRMRQEVGVAVHTEKQAQDRGTGEKLKDIMKSDIRSRSSKMKHKLAEIREARKLLPLDLSVPKIPILGFYSAGKSTLFNILTTSSRETSDEAFTTMLLKSSWSNIAGYPIELIDTIGLVDLPPTVIDAFSLMLETIFSSHLIMICIDVTLNEMQFKDQLSALFEYYEKFSEEHNKYNILFVLTKCDLIDEKGYFEKLHIIEKELMKEDAISYNYYEFMGTRIDKPEYVKKTFVNLLDTLMQDQLKEFEFTDISPSQISLIYDHARVIKEEWHDGKVTIKGVLPLISYEKNLVILEK